jgi:hypothetical protein
MSRSTHDSGKKTRDLSLQNGKGGHLSLQQEIGRYSWLGLIGELIAREQTTKYDYD